MIYRGGSILGEVKLLVEINTEDGLHPVVRQSLAELISDNKENLFWIFESHLKHYNVSKISKRKFTHLIRRLLKCLRLPLRLFPLLLQGHDPGGVGGVGGGGGGVVVVSCRV